MRKLIYHVAITLDGAIEDENGSFEGFLREGDHLPDFAASVDSYAAVLMGRRTYEVGLRQGIADPYPKLATYVFSNSMEQSPARRVTLVRSDAASFVRELKQTPGGIIWLCGGGVLASALFDGGLIDEVIVKLNPVLFGSGTRMLSKITAPVALELTSTKVYECGVVLLTYRVKAQDLARSTSTT